MLQIKKKIAGKQIIMQASNPQAESLKVLNPGEKDTWEYIFTELLISQRVGGSQRVCTIAGRKAVMDSHKV